MSGKKIAILATGGTIAGASADPEDRLTYTAGTVPIAQLLASVPALRGVPIESEQVAQIDSRDMSLDIWRDLALACARRLAQPDVAGLVVTHGTDTLEETAFFLQSVLAPAKPVVLTCAMRPTTALVPDGPQNLLDAVAVAGTTGARGVVVVCAGSIHDAVEVTKLHIYRLDAFSSGDAGPLGFVEEGHLRMVRDWPTAGEPAPLLQAQSVLARLQAGARWPRVEIVTSHAGADGTLVQALLAQGVQGLVVAAPGNGSVHQALQAALLQAQAAGVKVLRASRCAQGRVTQRAGDALPGAGGLSPVKARIALMLQLLHE